MNGFFRKVNVVIIVAIVFSMLLIVGTAYGSTTTAVASGEQITIGVSLPTLTMSWFVYVNQAIISEAQKLGVKLIDLDPNNSISTQIDQVGAMISRHVNGILLDPIDEQGSIPAVLEADKAGIPVALVDRTVNLPSSDYLLWCGAANEEGGRLQAAYLVDQLWAKYGAPKGNVIEITGEPGSSPAVLRQKGFEEFLKYFPDIHIVAVESGQFTEQGGLTAVEDLLASHRKDLQAIVFANDDSLLGGIRALQAYGIDPSSLILIGFDTLPQTLPLIEKGEVTATIEQFPAIQVKTALDDLVSYIRTGQLPPKEIPITPAIISATSIGAAEIK